MKRILLLSFLLLQTIIYSQESDYGNQPVVGVTPVKRVNDGSLDEPEKVPQTTTIPRTAGIPTGNSSEVGTTEGQLEVSLTGGATYSIPIAVPPGINGVTPRVSLSYNSQGGNDLAGYGWNISGVSAITRIPSTQFHDGVIDGVDFDHLDRFAFDGQRLILKSGTYGGDGAEYETENFSTVKITSHGVSPFGAHYGPAYFLVQYPDGSIAQYGNSTDSRCITKWSVTFWQNPQGIRINYLYTTENNGLIINRITYGPDNSSNTIQFGYESRRSTESGYTGGQSFAQNKILKTIAVSGNNTGFRHYVLAHQVTSLGYERLTSITEKNGDNTKSYNPMVFTYENTVEALTYLPPVTADLSVGNIRSSNSATVSGDFNGDGSMDFLLYPTIGPNAKRKYWLFDQLNNQYINLGWEHNVGAFEEIFPVSWLTWNGKLLPQQGWCVVKQNAATNITSFQTYSTGISSPIYTQGLKEYAFPKHIVSYYDPNECNDCPFCPDPIEPRRSNNQGGNVTPGQAQPLPGVQGFDVYMELDVPKRYISGDFNGDGLTDVAVINKSVSYNETYNCQNSYRTIYGGKTYFVNLDRRLTSNFVNEAGFLGVSDDSKILVADYNGDGKEDIYVFDTGLVKIYTLTSNNQFVNVYSSTRDTDIVTTLPILLGDYNGDGKMDFLTVAAGTPRWIKYLSTGNGFAKVNVASAFSYIPSDYLNVYNYIATDYNNDGKTDIVVAVCRGNAVNPTSGSIYVFLRANEGDGFNTTSTQTSGEQPAINQYALPIFLTSNRANKKVEVAFISNNKIHHFQSSKDMNKEKLLKQITYGNGASEHISYQPLDPGSLQDGNTVYTNSNYTENYPNTDISTAPALQVVTKIEVQTNNVYKKRLFSYHGGVSNLEGLGFLGFRTIMETNWHNDDEPIISSVSRYDIARRGVLTERFNVLNLYFDSPPNYTPSNFITKTTMAYTHELLPNKVFKIKNIATTSINALDNTSTEATMGYDSYNNPLTSTTVTKNAGVTEQTKVVTVVYEDRPSGPRYYIGRPVNKTTSVTHNGDTMTDEMIFTYNASHLVERVRMKGHNTNYLTEDNLYDPFGNLTSKTVTATGLAPRVKSFTYDTSGRFLISSTDFEGLVTSYTYNTSSGDLLSQTLPSKPGYPLTTSYLYDSWGKTTRITDYLGKSIHYVYNNNNTNGTSSVFITGDDGSYKEEYYDQLERNDKTGVKNSNGEMVYATTIYDVYDRPVRVSEPLQEAALANGMKLPMIVMAGKAM